MKLSTLNDEGLKQWISGLLESDGSIASYCINQNFDRWTIQPRVLITGAFYSGLIDGDGYISCNIKKSDCNAINFKINSCVGYCGNDACININRLREFCKKNHIKYSITIYKRDEKSTPLYSFKINNIEGVKRFLELINPYLGFKKFQSLIWLNKIYME